jgi:integrase
MKAENATLNKRETALLLETFKKHYPKDYPMALTLARTGMRFGEVCALQWGDIDFNSRFILVQRNVTNRGQIDTPKNNKTHRVDISLQLVEVLTELRKQRKVETLKKGWGEVPEWVFISSKRKPIIMNNWRDKIFNRALEKAGLRKIRVHDLRHGYAHQLIKAGATLLFVSHQLGHSSIKITADCYGHIKRDDEDSKKLIVDCLDDDAFTRNLYATKEINNV